MNDFIAYKVLTADEWSALSADRFYGAAGDLVDGFVHLSTAAQLTETVNIHFRGQENLVIAAIDLAPLRDYLRWKRSRHDQLFPHLFGRLRTRHVIASCPLQRSADGTVQFPS